MYNLFSFSQPTSVASSTDAKWHRALLKKLREIETIKLKRARGDTLAASQLAKLATETAVVADLNRAGIGSTERKAVCTDAAKTLKPPVLLQQSPKPDSNNSKRRAATAERLAAAGLTPTPTPAGASSDAPTDAKDNPRPAKRLRDSAPTSHEHQREPHNFFSAISNAATSDGVSGHTA